MTSRPARTAPPMRRLTIPELHAEMRAQGVSGREHVATVCPVCGTVQSIASLIRAGCDPDIAERQVGFSCEGRQTGAGPAASPKDDSAKAAARRLIRGCDWTLGGLFSLHRIEVIDADDKAHPFFDLATPEQAQELERFLATTAEGPAA